jgi:hypothetical protein
MIASGLEGKRLINKSYCPVAIAVSPAMVATASSCGPVGWGSNLLIKETHSGSPDHRAADHLSLSQDLNLTRVDRGRPPSRKVGDVGRERSAHRRSDVISCLSS